MPNSKRSKQHPVVTSKAWLKARAALLARFTRSSVPSLHVLAWSEISDNRKVRLVSAVGR